MRNGMRFHNQPLSWHPRAPAATCPFRPWLIDRGSLTRRIQKRCDAFSVRPVLQRYGRACRDEAGLVGVRPRELALLREVYLYCGTTPVVFAHSVVPRRGLRGPWRGLSRLGNKSLGAALFANPAVQRMPLQFKKLNPHHQLHRRACRLLEVKPAHLWARRSVFGLHGSPILVTEVFLPDILGLHP
jgi:chorismate--pyruvate lyase